MAEGEINYPDILGAITGGVRLNFDVVQCALGIRPPLVPAGHFFELVFLLQNASDGDVDVVVTPELPEQDAGKNRDRFVVRSPRLRIGLRPAEAGYVALPVATSPKTAPGSGYRASLNLEIKRIGRHPQRIRDAAGGGPFLIQELAPEVKTAIETLRAVPFSFAAGSKKHSIQASFDVLPPALATLKNPQSEWVSLWTMRDYLDDYIIAQKVWPQAQSVLKQMSRDVVFLPLLKTTQANFQAGGYALLPPEAIYITKLLTLILEMRAAEPTPTDPQPAWPRWFVKLCHLLFQEPGLAAQVEPLITRLLYADVTYDAMLYGFTMIGTVTNEDFGTQDEVGRYAEDIVNALVQHQPLDFARAYFPLVLGGLIANTRVTMAREQVQETVHMLSKALDARRKERDADNGFIFDLADRLIGRALDVSG